MPVLRIEQQVFATMFEYAKHAEGEISGFAHFNVGEQSIDQIFPLLEQECSSAETEMSEKTMAQLSLTKWSAKLNVWWHSHGTMSTFWSQTDKNNIESLGLLLPYLISIVVNKKREYKCRIDWFVPHRATIEDVSLQVDFNVTERQSKILAEDVKKKVKTAKSVVTVYGPGNYNYPHEGGYGSHYYSHGSPENIKWLEKYGFTIKEGRVVKRADAQSEIPFGDDFGGGD